MRQWLAVAALGAAFLVMPAFAQRRGGVIGHASTGGFHGSAMAFHGAGFGPSFPSSYWRTGFRGSYYGRGRGYYRGYPYFRGGRSYYAGHYAYGYPAWGWYDDSYYSQPSYDSRYDSGQDNQVDQQQLEIDRLNDEVARLHGRSHTPAEVPADAAARPEEFTELVFRDKHTEQVQNYAIVGQTLWILNAPRMRRIAVSDLDVVATRKANEDRGVDFSLPD
jgi:hypothetical protein